MTEPVVVAISEVGRETAMRAARALGAALHGRAGRVAAPVLFEETTEHLRALFLARRPIIAVAASGVVVRALAPALSAKAEEPPVLALSPDGASVVPLLGGHRGANALAERLARALGAHAAITTAGDVALGVALDAPPPGWRLANPEDAAPVMADLLGGAPAQLIGSAPWLAPLAERAGVETQSGPPERARVVCGANALDYHGQILALGAGCERGAEPDELIALAERAFAAAGLAPSAVAALFTLDLKADEPAMRALAERFGVPLRLFDAETLERQTPRLAHPSETVFRAVGCHGVAEAAALAGAGPNGRLAIEKTKSARATIAVAACPGLITTLEGRPRGRLSVVGVGPGQAAWRTPEASRAVAEADEVVGYGLYLDLLGPLAAGKAARAFALGEEEARCRYALEAAGRGARVALICSGDAGIYAMGALVCALLDRGADQGGVSDAARRAEIRFTPGVSALQAASARAGALIGHDFCAISLSDLMTPWPVIEQRIRAAAEGDFVIAFYNPVSKRRRSQLAEARAILLAARPPETPVLLASELGRPGERLRRRTLESLAVDEVDMLTVVLVGSSQSRAAAAPGQGAENAWLYTPRGYAVEP